MKLRSSRLLKLAARLASVGPEHKAIFRGMSYVMAFALLGKAVAAVKEMVVAWRFGVSETVDAYLFTFNIINFPLSIWFGALTALAIPLLGSLSEFGEKEVRRFRQEMLSLTLISGLLIGILTLVVLLFVLKTGLSGLKPNTSRLAETMVFWLTLCVPLGFIIHYGSVLIMSGGQHANTLYEALPAASIMIVVLLISSDGASSLVIGTIMGSLVHLIVIIISLKRRKQLHSPILSLSSSAWSNAQAGIGVMIFAQTLQTIAGVIDQFCAAHLTPGAISTLGYSERIMSLILTLSATAISRALLPILSAPQAISPVRYDKITKQWAGILFCYGILLMIAGWILAVPATSFLFQRGAFNHENTMAVASILKYSMTRLPFYLCSLVFVQYIISKRNYKKMFYVASLNVISKSMFLVFTLKNFGVHAIVLSSSFMYFISLIYIVFYARNGSLDASASVGRLPKL